MQFVVTATVVFSVAVVVASPGSAGSATHRDVVVVAVPAWPDGAIVAGWPDAKIAGWRWPAVGASPVASAVVVVVTAAVDAVDPVTPARRQRMG